MSLCSNDISSFNYVGPSALSLEQAQGNTSVSSNTAPLRNRSTTPIKKSKLLTISAIDHQSTKLQIPLSAVTPTQALEDDGLVPGVCRLHLEGRCRQGDRCFQVHVNPQVLESLRREALNSPSCCYFHGCKCSYEGYPLGLTITVLPNSQKEKEVGARWGEEGREDNMNEPATKHATPPVINLHYITPTKCLWSMYKQSGVPHLVAQRSQVCKQHRKGLCRFGDECSYLHICRELFQDPNPNSTGELENSPCGAFKQGQASYQTNSYNTLQSNNHNVDLYSHRQPLLLSPTGGESVSFGGSLSNRVYGSIPSLSSPDQQGTLKSRGPLLRPLQAPTSSKNGSFSHNPYAEANSLQ